MHKHTRLMIPILIAGLLALLVGTPSEQVQAATIDRLAVSCFSTIVTGTVDSNTQSRAERVPYVRVEVTKSGDLSSSLGSRVVPVQADGTYMAWMMYPRQPADSLLIVSVGEWDGQVYLAPATLTSRVCGTNTSPVTPTAPPATSVFTQVPSTPVVTRTPVTPSATYPPVTPMASETYPPASRTPVGPSMTPSATHTLPPWTPSPTYTPLPPSPTYAPGYSQSWTVTTTLTQDTCTGAGAGATVPATLRFTADNTLTGIDRGVLSYNMRLAGTHTGYIGQAYSGDATYTLDLFFDGDSAFTAYEQVTFASNPGCFWSFEWRGTAG